MITGRTAKTLEATAAQHERISAIVADVARPADVKRTIDEVRSRHGRLDTLVNNAGIAEMVPLSKTDAEHVRRLLLRIAESDPRVLRQPPPSCWLTLLGASTLDFELRVFVGEILDRNQVRHALYERIIAAFREEGIEIAFPQMDLWVRQAATPAGATPALEATTRPKG